MQKGSVLIVDDEKGIRNLLQLFLEKKGYRVLEADNGLRALSIVDEANPDVILMDIEMPEMDGFDVCEEIRRHSKVPILFVSCKKDSFDKMTGFDVGGDDYITKPFDFHELEARIQALIRRNAWVTEEKLHVHLIKYNNLHIDVDSCEVQLHGNPIRLLNKEYQLLLLFAQHPNQIWTTDQLYDHIWGYQSEGTPQTVKVHISNLRRKLNEYSNGQEYIQTVRGFGYKFTGHELKTAENQG